MLVPLAAKWWRNTTMPNDSDDRDTNPANIITLVPDLERRPVMAATRERYQERPRRRSTYWSSVRIRITR